MEEQQTGGGREEEMHTSGMDPGESNKDKDIFPE